MYVSVILIQIHILYYHIDSRRVTRHGCTSEYIGTQYQSSARHRVLLTGACGVIN